MRQTLGPYRILAELGRGAMGEVYRAHDPRLDREVAVKLLPEEFRTDPDRLRRFDQEARAAAALNHPNILSVYDIGTAEGVPYFVCELLSGETLRARLDRGPLSVRQVADYGTQIARGLAAAHERGVVHRDLKPENLFVTTDGQVKILDFGLAKASGPVDELGDQETITHAIGTTPGLILGTVPYMSPEQVRGAAVDARSDIFSLGAVLFEMLTGRRAFAAAGPAETMSAILTRDPFNDVEAPADRLAPPVLSQIVKHCLEKDPRQRFQSARDIAFGLEVLAGTDAGHQPAGITARPRRRRTWLFAAAAALVVAAVAFGIWRLGTPSVTEPAASGAIATLAVLPLANLSGNADDEYFTDGMTDSLITDLARVQNLAVIARAAVFRYKDQARDPQEAGRELGAKHVLDGSVQRAGDKVRVNIRLVDVATGYNVWAEPFEESVKDVFVIQNKVSRRVVDALQLKLSPVDARRGEQRPTANEQAYDAYLQGMYFVHRAGGRDRAITSFEEAVQADPQFALAHAALGSQYTQRFFYADADRKVEKQAFVAIEKALALDPDLAEGYLARAQLAWSLPNGFPHEQAVRDLRRALAIKPSLVDAHVELGKVYLHIGLLDKSIEANAQALRLDPGSRAAFGRTVAAHVYLGECQKALEFSAGRDQSRGMRVLALLCLGQRDKVAAELAANKGADIADLSVRSFQALLLAQQGDAKAAREKIAQVQVAASNVEELSHLHHVQYYIGAVYAMLGDAREAVPWLKKATREGMPCYPLFERDSALDKIRKDPEFVAFIKDLKAQWERFRTTL